MNYDELDPGIRHIVIELNGAGFVTTDSGDGVSKPQQWYDSGEAIPFKHVVAATTPEAMIADAARMAALLGAGWNVEATYQTLTQRAYLFVRELDPRETMESVTPLPASCGASEDAKRSADSPGASEGGPVSEFLMHFALVFGGILVGLVMGYAEGRKRTRLDVANIQQPR